MASALTVRAASLFEAFIPAASSSLTGKINIVFGVAVAYVAASAAYSAYNFYQAYQLSANAFFDLSDPFKLVKCEALLLEAEEKQSVKPLLQKCEALLDSITDVQHSHDKERLLIQLAKHHAKTEPESAYSFALHQTSSSCLFHMAKCIHAYFPDFDPARIFYLYQRADFARKDEQKNLNTKLISMDFKSLKPGLNWELKLAKAFHKMGSRESVEQCLRRAQTLAATGETPLDRILALCEIVSTSSSPLDKLQPIVTDAAKELALDMPTGSLIVARIALAHAYLCVKDTQKMDQELIEILQLFENDHSTIHKHLFEFTWLINNLKKDTTLHFEFKNYPFEELIHKSLNHIDTLADENQADAYLSLSNFYEYRRVPYDPRPENSRHRVDEKIRALAKSPETELNCKIRLNCHLICRDKMQPNVAQQSIQELEKLYDLCPLEAEAPESWDKDRLAQEIAKLYHFGKADQFFQKYISDTENRQDIDALTKVNKLVDAARSLSSYKTSQQQKRALLEAAEELLPQLGASDQLSIAQAKIADGYLQVDRQKSLSLLPDLKSQQAKICMITAVVAAASLAALHFYPAASPVLLLGVAVWRAC